MAKHSYAFKKKIVLEYLNSDGVCISISRKYEMASSSQLLKWVAAYKAFGDNGLKRFCAGIRRVPGSREGEVQVSTGKRKQGSQPKA